MPLYEVAIISKPSKKETEEGTEFEKLILAPTAVIARDPQSAVIAAITRESLQGEVDPNRCEVLVRSFA